MPFGCLASVPWFGAEWLGQSVAGQSGYGKAGTPGQGARRFREERDPSASHHR
jgi:hypothetical protein